MTTYATTGHTPTGAQLTKLASLQATQTSATATLASAEATLATAQAAKLAADKAFHNYRHYIYGGENKGGSSLDEGGPDTV